MNTKKTYLIIPVLFSAIGASWLHAEISSTKSDKDKSAQEPEPFYQQVLDTLKTETAANPDILPDIHPFRTAYNGEAPIPPQCYTKTTGKHNPCYVCHQDAVPSRENKMQDGELQVAYSFSDMGMTNHWHNLFEDRSERVAKISDQEILDWINEDNYSSLAPKLEQEGFKGWIPDLKNLHLGAGAFDQHGFALDGSHWVAFNYKPLPSTFWPTNGSTDDVMIRLGKAFRTNGKGDYSPDIYKANLAITEANVKGLDKISSLPVDENIVGVDLNNDGKKSIITEITKVDSYVGAAASEFIDTYLFPRSTEFLHTVRYVGVTEDNEITVSARMKEVRYMKKWKPYGKAIYEREYQQEGFAKEAGALPQYNLLGDHGLDNDFGWSVLGFIEGAKGELRKQTYEENLFCMGCHSSIGATIDKTFSFPRKVDGAAGWGYINLKGMLDSPNMGEKKGEIATYLERVGGGGEFRSNPEMFKRWFNEDGSVNHDAIDKAKDVYELITPSVDRALELNKAYKVIVADQDFIYGRDATVTSPINVYDSVDNETAPTLPESLSFKWDIRLDWNSSQNNSNK